MVTTVWLTLAAIAGGLLLGCALALARLSKSRWLYAPTHFYIWLFRGTPLMVQLIIIYTGLPQLGLKFSVVESALLGLILNEAAYLAEIRSRRNSVDPCGPNQCRARRRIYRVSDHPLHYPAAGHAPDHPVAG